MEVRYTDKREKAVAIDIADSTLGGLLAGAAALGAAGAPMDAAVALSYESRPGAEERPVTSWGNTLVVPVLTAVWGEAVSERGQREDPPLQSLSARGAK